MLDPIVMVTALKLLAGSNPDWVPDIALAERLAETGDRATLTTFYDAVQAGYRPPKIGMDMRVMVSEIRRIGREGENKSRWLPVVFLAERMLEDQNRSGLTTLYDTIMAGGEPF